MSHQEELEHQEEENVVVMVENGEQEESGHQQEEDEEEEGGQQQEEEEESGHHQEEDEERNKSPPPSHFRNTQAYSAWLRYGLPAYLLSTLGLLLASHIGSGVAAEYIIVRTNGTVFEQSILFSASIFTSVAELWQAKSYALAILIVITSIMWPYVKLLLTLYSWIVTFGHYGSRRERLLEVIDALGKWSFVDIFVFLIIMVTFRATIPLNAGVTMEVVVVPRWGFFGFVLATMLSFVGTHVILYLHRRLVYKNVTDDTPNPSDEEDQEEQQADNDSTADLSSNEKQSLVKMTNTSMPLLVFLLTTTLGMILAGCIVYIFKVTNRQGEEVESDFYSVLSVGSGVPGASLEPNSLGVRFIQAMYYVLGIALPLLNVIVFGIFYLWPMAATRHRRVFMTAEICFSWSSIEVLLISCIFSVMQIPKFGNGLINSGCTYCYTVGSALLPELSMLAIASFLSISVNIWLYRKAHSKLYPKSMLVY